MHEWPGTNRHCAMDENGSAKARTLSAPAGHRVGQSGPLADRCVLQGPCWPHSVVLTFGSVPGSKCVGRSGTHFVSIGAMLRSADCSPGTEDASITRQVATVLDLCAAKWIPRLDANSISGPPHTINTLLTVRLVAPIESRNGEHFVQFRSQMASLATGLAQTCPGSVSAIEVSRHQSALTRFGSAHSKLALIAPSTRHVPRWHRWQQLAP